MKTYTKQEIGEIGESWVRYILARNKITSQNLNFGFDYDIITINNAKIEVKTSTLRTHHRKRFSKIQNQVVTNYYDKWAFANNKNQSSSRFINGESFRKIKMVRRDRDCDFFALVCMDKKYNIIKTYIVPKKIIGCRKLITIGLTRCFLEPYLERWELIKEFS